MTTTNDSLKLAELLKTPICKMDSEELAFLITSITSNQQAQTLPMVNLDVAVDGQNASLGEVLNQFEVCRVAALHSYLLCRFLALGEVVHCQIHQKELAVYTINHLCLLPTGKNRTFSQTCTPDVAIGMFTMFFTENMIPEVTNWIFEGEFG